MIVGLRAISLNHPVSLLPVNPMRAGSDSWAANLSGGAGEDCGVLFQSRRSVP